MTQILTVRDGHVACDQIPFQGVFSDSGAQFIEAVTAAFQFAHSICGFFRRRQLASRLEFWDQATQYHLSRGIRPEAFFPGVELLLEKDGARAVWDAGYPVVERHRSTSRRRWTMPDGLIRTNAAPIAVEFDHGTDVGRWATQLLKAARVTHSPQIQGVIYLFSWLGQEPPSLTAQELSAEFRSILVAAARKSVVAITIPIERQNDLASSVVVQFLDEVYRSRPRFSLRSKTAAEHLIDAIGATEGADPDPAA